MDILIIVSVKKIFGQIVQKKLNVFIFKFCYNEKFSTP